MCAFVIPLLDKRLANRWKWLFGTMAFAYSLPLVIAVLIGQSNIPEIFAHATANLTPQLLMAITAAAALALALYDRVYISAEQRTWHHWTGIATAVCLAILPAAGRWLLGD